MKQTIFTLAISFLFQVVTAQSYFPPTNSGTWDTMPAEELGWCQNKIDSLYDFLNANHTKAFILLKDGKIVLEKYFNGHSRNANWYWASAGKSLTASVVGIAQQEHLMKISDTTSKYLGAGWTSCTPEQEAKITIRNQLTMTTGLDDGTGTYCTDDTCLHYLADAGTRWAYHNAPYTLLDKVIESATGKNLNLYITQKIKTPTGMDGAYIYQDYNNIFYSTARSMARYGLLILNKGNWDGNQVLSDTDYFNEMTNTSQDLNKSYGYLWWLNGKGSFMLPQSQIIFPGNLVPAAPDDMIAALGKNGQFINVIPSLNMVWIRMGEAPDSSPIAFTYSRDIWNYLNALNCGSSQNKVKETSQLFTYPNPVKDYIYLQSGKEIISWNYKIFDSNGKQIMIGKTQDKINLSLLNAGIYLLQLSDGINNKTIKVNKI